MVKFKDKFANYELSHLLYLYGFDVPTLAYYDEDGKLYPSVMVMGDIFDYSLRDFLSRKEELEKYEGRDLVFVDYEASSPEIPAPTFDEITDWLLDKHHLHVYVDVDDKDDNRIFMGCINDTKHKKLYYVHNSQPVVAIYDLTPLEVDYYANKKECLIETIKAILESKLIENV